MHYQVNHLWMQFSTRAAVDFHFDSIHLYERKLLSVHDFPLNNAHGPKIVAGPTEGQIVNTFKHGEWISLRSSLVNQISHFAVESTTSAGVFPVANQMITVRLACQEMQTYLPDVKQCIGSSNCIYRNQRLMFPTEIYECFFGRHMTEIENSQTELGSSDDESCCCPWV